MGETTIKCQWCGKSRPNTPGMCPHCHRFPNLNKDKLYEEIRSKIENKTVTLEDFQKLLEATPPSARDRIRRRSTAQLDTVRSHQDDKGHSDLKPPKMADRVQPKRERSGNTQMQHRGRLGHRHSSRSQKGRSKDFSEEINFIKLNIGKEITEDQLNKLNRRNLFNLSKKLLIKPNINRDWLFDLCKKLK